MPKILLKRFAVAAIYTSGGNVKTPRYAILSAALIADFVGRMTTYLAIKNSVSSDLISFYHSKHIAAKTYLPRRD